MITIQPLHFLDEEMEFPVKVVQLTIKLRRAPVVSFYKSSIKWKCIYYLYEGTLRYFTTSVADITCGAPSPTPTKFSNSLDASWGSNNSVLTSTPWNWYRPRRWRAQPPKTVPTSDGQSQAPGCHLYFSPTDYIPQVPIWPSSASKIC